MFGKAIVRSLVAATVMVFAVVAQAVTIDLVPVGNPGNAADDTGYGAVGYNYQIGKYEVTAGQYAEFLNAVAKTDQYGLYNPDMDSNPVGCQITRHGISGNYTYDFSGRPSGTESDWANRPVNYVSWACAARFANWMTNGQPVGLQNTSTTEDGSYCPTPAGVVRKANARWVIPTENEWYKAAYHKNDGVTGNYFDYPTASDGLPSNSLVNPDPGNNANFYHSGYTIDSPYYRTPAGEFEDSQSPYGTFDQGGNVWEWTEALINPPNPGLHLFRGGSFGDTYFSDTMCASYRYIESYVPPYGEAVIGFRVAFVPEPGSITLLFAAAASLLAYAWRRRQAA
jgi:formylglycine-generating enzyme required for sulfatase activity